MTCGFSHQRAHQAQSPDTESWVKSIQFPTHGCRSPVITVNAKTKSQQDLCRRFSKFPKGRLEMFNSHLIKPYTKANSALLASGNEIVFYNRPIYEASLPVLQISGSVLTLCGWTLSSAEDTVSNTGQLWSWPLLDTHHLPSDINSWETTNPGGEVACLRSHR